MCSPKPVVVTVHVCIHYVYTSVRVCGGEVVAMVTAHCHPQWVLKDKASHTHSRAHSTTGPAEPDQYFSPFKEQNSENGFSGPDCSRALDLGFFFFTLNTQSAKWQGFLCRPKIIPGLNLFLSFHFTVLMDPFTPFRTSVFHTIFV